MLTWEPWAPTPPRLGTAAQGYAQRAYDNRAIASGRWDSYIRSWARAIASSGFSSVYVRFGQEQNGGYYPWSNDPREYVAAWRRIYKIFHEEGASNAVFLYSAAPQPSESNTSWARGFWRYWPGRAYVGAVGLTAINYGVGGVCVAVPCAAGATDYAPAIFLQRLRLEQELSGKHVVIPELNTARSGATAWLRELASQLRTARVARDLSAVVLSQQPSRASAQTVTGDLNWNALTDPGLRSSLQSFVAQIQRRARKRVVSDRSDKEARSDRL
jgi:beta-mannanase